MLPVKTVDNYDGLSLHDTYHQLLVATLKVNWQQDSTAFRVCISKNSRKNTDSSTVCSIGDQQDYGIGGCTGRRNSRRSLERYQDSPAGSGQRNDRISQVAKKEELDI